MKTVGIIGGIGPASTLDYYKGIVDGYRLRSDDDSYPKIIINSIDMTEMLSYVAAEDWDKLVAMLAAEIQKLAAAGADFAAISSNTPHLVFDRLKEISPLPLVSITDAACNYAKQQGCKKVLALGTLFTMKNGLYTAALK